MGPVQVVMNTRLMTVCSVRLALGWARSGVFSAGLQGLFECFGWV